MFVWSIHYNLCVPVCLCLALRKLKTVNLSLSSSCVPRFSLLCDNYLWQNKKNIYTILTAHAPPTELSVCLLFYYFLHIHGGFADSFFKSLVWDICMWELVGYGGRKIRGAFALLLIISLFLSLAYEPTDASLCIFPANYKASSLPCSNKKPLYSTNHCISLRLVKH